MFQYNLTSTPSFSIDKKTIDNIFVNIWNKISQIQKWTVNIVFYDAFSIQNLNKTYRDTDKVTDVLSFHYYEVFDILEENDIAWEVIMCESKIIEQGKEYKLWTEKEFYKLLIHSLLHILWYDHEQDEDYQIMQSLENEIWKEVFEK